MAGAVKKSASTAVAPLDAPEAVFEKSAETFEKSAEAVSAPVAELQENVRKVVEKGLAETRAAYAKAKAAAEEATSALETSYSTATKGVVAFNTKALDALRANAEANFDFLKSVVSAKSVSEFVTLQSEHTRKQVEAISAQTKEIAALAQKVANDTAEPIKSQVAKTFKLAV